LSIAFPFKDVIRKLSGRHPDDPVSLMHSILPILHADYAAAIVQEIAIVEK
jgi:hypothetical protein